MVYLIHFASRNSEPFQKTGFPKSTPNSRQISASASQRNATAVKGWHYWPQIQQQVTNIRGTNLPTEKHTLSSMGSILVAQVQHTAPTVKERCDLAAKTGCTDKKIKHKTHGWLRQGTQVELKGESNYKHGEENAQEERYVQRCYCPWRHPNPLQGPSYPKRAAFIHSTPRLNKQTCIYWGLSMHQPLQRQG